jgi:hypothetical protein
VLVGWTAVLGLFLVLRAALRGIARVFGIWL